MADLYTATRLALRRGLETSARGRRAQRGDARGRRARCWPRSVSATRRSTALFERMPEIGFQRGRPDQLAWQAASLRERRHRRHARARAAGRRARRARWRCSCIRPTATACSPRSWPRSIVAAWRSSRRACWTGRTRRSSTVSRWFPAEARNTPSAEEVEARLEHALAGSLDAVKPTRRAQPRHLRHFRIAPQIGFDARRQRPDPAEPGVHRPARACSPTWRRYCASSRCACTTRASPRSANAPRTCSRSPPWTTRGATSHSTRCNSRRCAMRCAPASKETSDEPDHQESDQEDRQEEGRAEGCRASRRSSSWSRAPGSGARC